MSEESYAPDRDALGVHIEGIALDCAVAGQPDASGTCDVRCFRGDAHSSLPPAALLPRLLGEPVRVDTKLPGHARGTGLEWPADAWVDAEHGAGRFPTAYAWAMLCSTGDTPWPWDPPGDRQPRRACTPADALGATVSAVLSERGVALRENGPDPVVVIPNNVDESAQDDLLNSIQSRGRRVRLLWRPVAAVLHWIEQYARNPVVAGSVRMRSGAKVMALHLGADGFECDLLETVRDAASGRYVPARRRPLYRSAPWLGVALTEVLTHLCLSRASSTDHANLWRTTWASPWPLWARAILTQGASEDIAIACARRLGFGPALIRGIRPSWERMATSVDVLGESLFAARPGSLREFRSSRGLPTVETDLLGWLNQVRNRLRDGAGEVIGCVATGTFAALPIQGTTLAFAVARRILGHVPDLAVVEGPTEENGSPTARGAALYAARLAAGFTGYYDTLPPLRVLTMKMGRPQWSDLLKVDDRFVEGGKPFEPPDREGYFIRENEATVVLQVVLGEHPTVRSVESRLPRRAESNEPIRLRLSMEPARGNAKVRIVPQDPHLLEGHAAIFLDWKTSQDTKLTPDEVLRSFPRICPEIEPRCHSADLWRNMVGDFQRYLQILSRPCSQQEIQDILLKAKSKLQRGDDRIRRTEGVHARAVSSDGEVSVHQEVLNKCFDVVVRILIHGTADKGLILRLLAYGSANHKDFLRHLDENIGSRTLTENHNAGLFACGECLREPGDIARFAESLLHRIRAQQSGLNEWLRALAKILMYRERACELLTSRRCDELTRRLLDIFCNQVEQGKGNYLFRHSALCIVFLLRRRIFDNSYLAPNSDLAERVKKAFRDAKRKAEQRRIHLVGGTVNLPEILDRLIDYIDQQGHGTISEGLFDVGEGGEE